MTTNSPTSLLDFIRRRVGVGELDRRRVDRNSVDYVAPGAVKDTEGFCRQGKELQGKRICTFYLHLMQFSYHTIFIGLEQERALGCKRVDCYGDQKQFWHPKFQKKHSVFGRHVESF